MQEFEYEVVDRSGRLVKGQAQADSVTELVRSLSADGHTVVEVNERRAAAAPFRASPRAPAAGRGRLRFTSLRPCSSPACRSPMRCSRSRAAATIPPSAPGSSPSRRRSCAGRAFAKRSTPVGLHCPSTSTTWWRRGSSAGVSRSRCARPSSRCATTCGWRRRCAARCSTPSILVVSGICGGAAGLRLRGAPVLQPPRRRQRSAAALRGGAAHRRVVQRALVVACRGPCRRGRSRSGARLASRRCASRPATSSPPCPCSEDGSPRSDTARWASVMGAMLTSRVELMDALGLATRSVRISRRKAALEQVAGDVRGGTALSAALEKRERAHADRLQSAAGGRAVGAARRRCCARSPRSTRRTARGG